MIDDDLASELMVENLGHRGHDVRRYSSADEALKDIESIAKSDLIILDLIMPHVEGLSGSSPDGARCIGMLVFRELRKRRAELPILVFTANQDPTLIDVIDADKNARYISKWSAPKFHDFVATVHGMLGTEPQPSPPRVFIVHGHDDKTKLEVKNYLQNVLHLPEPVILHEQPNMGRTLIEKFEDLSVCTELAFVILTPDDPPADVDDDNAKKRRARQNVILELGFFLGKLGRRSGRIFLLRKGPIEIPSDLSGVVYIDITGGIEASGEQIRREMKAIQ
ncbi:MAG: TIR domain-containing protein [Candidatus Acidiferrales bacterium]